MLSIVFLRILIRENTHFPGMPAAVFGRQHKGIKIRKGNDIRVGTRIYLNIIIYINCNSGHQYKR